MKNFKISKIKCKFNQQSANFNTNKILNVTKSQKLLNKNNKNPKLNKINKINNNTNKINNK